VTSKSGDWNLYFADDGGGAAKPAVLLGSSVLGNYLVILHFRVGAIGV